MFSIAHVPDCTGGDHAIGNISTHGAEPIAAAARRHSADGPRTRAKGGFYHDGRFQELMAVVEHYNHFMKLGLSDAEKHDLVEYLKIALTWD